MGGVEDRKGKELGKELGKGEVKDNSVSEGDRKQAMIIWYLMEEGSAGADKEGEEQDGDQEEGESCYSNCDVTVMVFSCSTIF